jgi:hypothetical protein
LDYGHRFCPSANAHLSPHFGSENTPYFERGIGSSFFHDTHYVGYQDFEMTRSESWVSGQAMLILSGGKQNLSEETPMSVCVTVLWKVISQT